MSVNESEILSAREVSHVLNGAINKNMSRYQNASDADRARTVKILGIFEVDGATAGLFNGLWNDVTNRLMGALQPKSHEVAKYLGGKVGMHGPMLEKAATAAVVASTTIVTGSKYFAAIVGGHKKQFAERAKLAREIAPVLDEIQGNHSLVALLTAGSKNKVIKEHLGRMNKKSDVENGNNYLQLAVNVLPGFVTDITKQSTKQMWAGKYDPSAPPLEPKAAQPSNENIGGVLKESAATLGRGMAGPISESIVAQSIKRLEKSLQPNSALELIMHLHKQMDGSKHVRNSYSLPRESGGKSVSLEEYIGLTMIQHQKGLCDVDPEQTEIREALQEELMVASKVMAEGIRNGNMSAMSLVRLIGEDRVIKNNGRMIADEDEVQQHVDEMNGSQKLAANGEPKEFYQQVGFTKAQVKDVLKQLDGDEKDRFASMLPDYILRDAGMSAKQVETLREDTMARYGTFLAEAVLGLAAMTDEELKHDGLPLNSIRQLRKVAEAIEHKGEEAIKDFQLGAKNSKGIELAVLDWAVPTIIGNKEHYGTVLERGREVLDALSMTPANDEDVAERPAKKFTDKHTPRRDDILGEERDAANDSSFRAREALRKAVGSDLGFDRDA